MDDDYINIMKATFYVYFDLNQAVNSMDSLKYKSHQLKKLLFDYLFHQKWHFRDYKNIVLEIYTC